MSSARLRDDTRGATAVEYLIIVAIVGIAAIGAWSVFGDGLTSKTDEERQQIAAMAGSGAGTGGESVSGAPAALSVAPTASDGTPTTSDGTSGSSGDDGGGGFWGGVGDFFSGAGSFLWGTGKGIVLGAWDTVTGLASLGWSGVKGVWWVVTNPVEAAEGVWHAVTHPVETATAAWDFGSAVVSGIGTALGNAWETVKHGSWEERGDLFGRAVFEVALTVGTGGAGQATKARWLGKVDDVARAADRGADTARLAGAIRRGRQTIDDFIARSPKKVGQTSDNLDELMDAARVAKTEVDDITRGVADSTGGEALLAPIKSPGSVESKLMERGVSGPGDIVDYARSSVVYDNWEDVYRGFQELSERGEIVRVKDRFRNPAPGGYRDILVNVRTSNGHIAEIQLHYRPLLDAKNGPGHPLYEQTRDILRRADAENRSLTVAEQTEVDRLTRLSEDLYGEIWRNAAPPVGGGG